ncbi:MAG: zf-HC2 domain-containing protein [Candidatus Latescibacterota bacterium]|nr:MAG: zf-HC2 domain-containing protein [Candidatus Latescibacterota bacterium]
MDCRAFEERLDALVASQLSHDELRAAETHASSCRRCRELLEVVLGERDVLDATTREHLLASLLERTAGSACGRAREQLCAWVDGELQSTDAELVALHVDHCTGCAQLASALVALSTDLVALAEVEPDAKFVSDVLSETRALLARRVPLSARIRATWEQLLHRPRLAWEFATAGCFMLTLLCGLPFSPLRSMPQQALAVIQVNPASAIQATAQRAQPLVKEPLRQAWRSTGAPLITKSQRFADAWESEHPQSVAAWESLGVRARELREAVAGRNFAGASFTLQQMGGDLQALWNGLRVNREVEAPQAGAATTAEEEER